LAAGAPSTIASASWREATAGTYFDVREQQSIGSPEHKGVAGMASDHAAGRERHALRVVKNTVDCMKAGIESIRFVLGYGCCWRRFHERFYRASR
jgi:hypothetical protein